MGRRAEAAGSNTLSYEKEGDNCKGLSYGMTMPSVK